MRLQSFFQSAFVGSFHILWVNLDCVVHFLLGCCLKTGFSFGDASKEAKVHDYGHCSKPSPGFRFLGFGHFSVSAVWPAVDRNPSPGIISLRDSLEHFSLFHRKTDKGDPGLYPFLWLSNFYSDVSSCLDACSPRTSFLKWLNFSPSTCPCRPRWCSCRLVAQGLHTLPVSPEAVDALVTDERVSIALRPKAALRRAALPHILAEEDTAVQAANGAV